LLIVGVVVLVLMLGGLSFAFYTLVIKKDGESPTPEATPTMIQIAAAATDTAPAPTAAATATSRSATPTTIPTVLPTDTPLPTPTLRPPPEVITIGVRARVNLSEGLSLNLRDLPSLSGSTVITQLVAQAEVDVVEGPEDEGERRWWSVDGGAGRAGWVVEALGDDVLLLPVGWTDQMSPLGTAAPAATPTLTPTLAATATLTPTATTAPQATPTVAATPAVTPTTSPITPTVAPTPEGGIPSPSVGGRARVTTQYQFINLRAEAGLGAERVGELANGTVVAVLEGPEEVDGLRWWRVDDGQGNTGWAAERVGGEVLLVPVP
jgi:hypothetical protein